jgi:GNAT superfamily N-acetyltransferase
MSLYHLETLGRDAYINSIATIQDPQTLRFADQSMAWWDRHFSWNAQGCIVLCNEKNEHLCYLFSKIDRYSEYLTLYNLFTPKAQQRNGYATHLLRMALALGVEKHVRRITFSSISTSLDFYRMLGFIYWGINDIGDYYCNLPLPREGLDGMKEMIHSSDIQTLLGRYLEKIHTKIDGNELKLSVAQNLIYKQDILNLGSSYVRENLRIFKNAPQ